jgi:hypothetical protein
MGIKIENNAASTLTTSVGTADTTIVLASGGGSLFPTLGAGDYFWATLVGEVDATHLEIVKVTARSGDALTVIRAQEGTIAKAFAPNDKFEMRITAQTMRDYSDAANLTGVLSIAQGGTGQTTEAGVRSALNVPTRTGGDASGIWGISITGSAPTLTTGRTVGMTGDVTWTSAAFDGSGNVTGTATLANSGVSAGTYRSVTVDTKGRVTGGTNPTTLSGYGITDAQPLDADLTSIAGLAGTSGFLKKTAANTWSLDTNAYLTGNQSISISGDASGSGATAISLTLANSGVTAGTYTKVTVDAKGRVTTGASLASGDLPTYTGSITSSQITTGLGYTPFSNAGGTVSGAISSSFAPAAINITTPGTTLYGFNFAGASSADNAQGITWSWSAGSAQAGIYVQSSGAYGTKMYFATTDSFATGAKTAIAIDHGGNTNIVRGALTQAGNQVLHAANYNSYSPTLTGSGASGTWGISITGNAATVSSITSGQVTGALGYTPLSNATSYLPLSGGTLTGELYVPNLTVGGQGRSSLNAIGGNIGATAGSWNNSQLELKNTDAGTVALAFHRAGYSSNTIEARDGNGLRIDGNYILHSANYSSYALPLSGGTLTGSLYTNGNSALATSDYRRIMHPGGATYVTQASTVTGAIKIKMPLLGSAMMMMATVRVYEYSTGRSFELVYGGHRDGANWYNEFCYMIGDESRGDINVRFGIDGTSDCVWIGETNTSWAYPQVWVTDVQIGYAGYSASWTTGWTVSFVTSFDTVNRGPRTAYRRITSANYSSYALPLSGGTLTGDVVYVNLRSSGGQDYGIIGRNGYLDTVNGIGSDPLELNYYSGGPVKIGSGTYGSKALYAVGIYDNGNQVLHAGNYNSYSPTLTGGNASGTWSINVTGSAGSAGSVAWSGVSSKPSYLMYYQGFTLDANTMDTNATGFTYAVNAPHTGPVARFSTGGGYDLWLNAPYSGGGTLSFRTRNGDAGSNNAWRTLLSDSNYNSYSPTLTGGNASGTWGINVTGTAGSISGYNNPTTAATANTIVYRDGNGHISAAYIFGSYFNSSAGNSENPTIGQIWTQSTGDNYLRKSTPAHLISQLGLLTTSNYTSYALPLSGGTMSGAISTGTGTSIFIGSQNVSTSAALRINWHTDGDLNYYIGKRAGAWTQPMDITFYTGIRYHAHQAYGGHKFYAAGYDTNYAFSVGDGDNHVRVYNNLYIGGNLALHAGNYNSYSPTLTGGNASGTWSINITGNAGTAYGLNVHGGRNNEANKVVRTDGNGYLQTGYINSSNGDENNASSPARVWGTNGSDSYLRTYQTGSLSVGSATNGRYVYDNGAYSGSAAYREASSMHVYYSYLGRLVYNNGAYSGSGWVEASDLGVRYAGRAQRANGNFYIDDNYGNGIVGVYASTRYQGVFAMGDSYKLPADGTTTGSLYGMAWSHPNAGGVAGNLDSHGMLVLINGGFGSCMSYSIKASGNVTAYSDERLKTNWRPMPESFVERLAAVKVGIYDRTDGERITQVGVSAQSLQKLLPEAITKAADEMGTLSVSYGNAAMAAAVELAKEIVALKKELAAIKYQVHKGD